MIYRYIKPVLIELYYTVIYYVPNFVRDLMQKINGRHTITVKTYLDTRWGIYRKQNWGDDMNVYICKHWFRRDLVSYATSLLSRLSADDNYALVGSILQSANGHTVVWGSGLIAETEIPRHKPKKICAVRGPLSREVLLSHGMDCPEVYGDPVLLLSRCYQPHVSKKYKIGIIPHIHDEHNEVIQQYLQEHADATLISMGHYDHWKDVVDEIASCEAIISSSLHGIILSDTYGVPNTWVEFSDKVYGRGFKFRDYLMSVKRPIQLPATIHQVEDIEQIRNAEPNYSGIDIDLQPLIDACPFQLPFNH